MKIIFTAGLASPIIAIGAILSGSVLAPGMLHFEYGSARSLTELTFVVAMAIPLAVISFLMLIRRKVAVILFPIGYIPVSIFPLFLKAFEENIDYVRSSVISALVIGLIAWSYLLISKEVKQYFLD
ncbi:MAG: hypothetical protein PVJ68_14500 [Candidatus Thiodiazotropha sp.]